jgi:hypothetical protein
MKYLFLCLFFICNFYSSFAQVYEPDSIWIEDPLCKPEIWQKLILEPRNNELWALYAGKEYIMMSLEELETIGMWKQELMLREIGNTTPCMGCCFAGWRPEGDSADYSISEEEFLEIMQQIEKAKKDKIEKAKKDKLNTKPKIKNKTKLK